MCLGVPGKVLEILEDGNAIIDIMGAQSKISIQLVKNVNIGDFVVAHAGCAIAKIDEDEANKTLELFKEIKDIYNE